MGVYKYDKANDKMDLIAGGTLYADVVVGSIIPYGGTTAPSGWLLCQGQAVSRTTYSELFKVIGTSFGVGDDSTTFNVPDLRETVPVGVGENDAQTIANHDIYTLGEFKDDNLGKHDHPLVVTTRATYNTAGVPVGVGNNNTPTTATHGKQLGVNYIIKAKHTPVPADFIDVVDEAMNECKILPYKFNRSSNISAFNRKFLYEGNSITWTATHTGRLTIRLIKHGDGYSLYLQNQNNVMLDSYDNFLGTNDYGTAVTDTSITLQAWVRKGDIITLTSNLPASTDWDDKYFVQTGLLAYNDNFD